MGFLDIFSSNKKARTNAKRKRAQDLGRATEKWWETGQKTGGKKVKRTGRGSDYRIGGTHYELKTGRAKLSKLQKKTKKKKGKKYKVVRVPREITGW